MRACGKGAFTALSLAATLLVAACAAPAAGESSAEAPGTIRIGVTPDQLVGTHDLVVTSLFPLSARTVYESLFVRDSTIETGGFEPSLATGYERSDDWKTVTLTLRDDVTFADGERLTAAGLKTYLEGMDAIDTWWFTTDWDRNSPVLTAADETTLVITSDRPMTLRYRGFLHALFTSVAIASPKALDDLEAAATEPLGSGPYVVESSTPDVGMSLVRNDDHWNADAYPFGRLELVVFADDVAALNALKADQIDAASLPIHLADEAGNQGFTLSEGLGRFTSLYVADRDGTTNPALADPRVRQAMALAIDREAINEAINRGYGRVTSQPFIEGQAEYVAGGDDRYAYDPERARELLAEAGYPDGFDLVVPSTSFLGITSWEPVVQQYLGDIGIRVSFETMEASDFFDAAMNSTAYPVLMYSEAAVSTLPVFITGDAVFNPFKVQDPVVDELWAPIVSGPDDAAAEAAAELGAYVLDQSLLIVLAAPSSVWVSAPGFTVANRDGYPELAAFGFEG